MADVNSVGKSVKSLSIKADDNIFDKLKKKDATSRSEHLRECFDAFDTDGDSFLSKEEFSGLLRCLYCRGPDQQPYPLSKKHEDDTFRLLDENKDSRIDLEEFKVCWYNWLKPILDPVSALLIIDVQNDFLTGSLALSECPAGQRGEEVVPPINHCIDHARFDHVVYSSDWHPHDHISFIENVKRRKLHPSSKVTSEAAQKLDTVVFSEPRLMEQKLWPAHCVQDSWGAKLHPDLKIVENALYVNKGTNPDIDSYSAFWDNHQLNKTILEEELTRRRVTDVYVCGVAYDVCVGASAGHALEHGFRTVIIEDACRGVDLADIDRTRRTLQDRGAVIVNSHEVPAMVSCEDRRPELGYFAALNVNKARQQLNGQGN